MNWFKKISEVHGEWWIDDNGQAVFADGDVGEYNHEGYVIGVILSSYFEMDSVDSPDIFDIEKKWGRVIQRPTYLFCVA